MGCMATFKSNIHPRSVGKFVMFIITLEEDSGRRWESRQFGSEMSAERHLVKVEAALAQGADPGKSVKWTEVEPVEWSPAWYLQKRVG